MLKSKLRWGLVAVALVTGAVACDVTGPTRDELEDFYFDDTDHAGGRGTIDCNITRNYWRGSIDAANFQLRKYCQAACAYTNSQTWQGVDQLCGTLAAFGAQFERNCIPCDGR